MVVTSLPAARDNGATQDFGHKPLVVLSDPPSNLSHPSKAQRISRRLWTTLHLRWLFLSLRK